MNNDYIQNLRYKLQKRVRKLNSADFQIFHFALKQFWGFLESNSVLKGILDDLELRTKEIAEEATKVVSENAASICHSEMENNGLSYYVLKKCVESENRMVEVNIAHNYSGESKHNDALDYFKEIFLESLYDYIDEQLDDQKALLALLRRYKHKCEWFHRDRLFSMWSENTEIGERLLALDLYDYLHDQGIDFFIEPTSVSGEVDLISSQSSEEPLIADVKIFDPGKSKGASYITKGFNQIYSYTLDYNEPFGYLLIFKTCEEDLKFSLSQSEQSTPFIIHNNKTIFLLTIDIYPHQKSASKRGKLKSIEITEVDFTKTVSNKELS